jgi:hypothetical protein
METVIKAFSVSLVSPATSVPSLLELNPNDVLYGPIGQDEHSQDRADSGGRAQPVDNAIVTHRLLRAVQPTNVLPSINLSCAGHAGQ